MLGILAIVTFVGHGIWVVLALIWCCLSVYLRQRQSDRQTCPRCSIHFGVAQSHCPSCGLSAGGALAVELRELERAARSIQYLIDHGAIDKIQGEQLYEKI